MSEDRVSIEDIAEVAGVSSSTVSRALNDNTRISAEMREEIKRLADDMGYTPNAVAQSLQTRKTNTIGLVVTSLDDPFFPKIVKGVEDVARDSDISVFLSVSYGEPEKEMQAIETFERRRVDGIMMASSRVGAKYVNRLTNINVPVVLLQNEVEDSHDFLHSVIADDRVGAQKAVRHLVELGHRRIGYIGASDRRRSNQRRLEGYRSALREAGVSAREDWAVIASADDVHEHGDTEIGRRVGAQLLDKDLTAIFCYNDMIAVGAVGQCKEQGINVPEECSIIGFDDISMSEYMIPPLSTVRVPKFRMGQKGMQVLIDIMNGKSSDDIVLQPKLIGRDSTAEV